MWWVCSSLERLYTESFVAKKSTCLKITIIDYSSNLPKNPKCLSRQSQNVYTHSASQDDHKIQPLRQIAVSKCFSKKKRRKTHKSRFWVKSCKKSKFSTTLIFIVFAIQTRPLLYTSSAEWNLSRFLPTWTIFGRNHVKSVQVRSVTLFNKLWNPKKLPPSYQRFKKRWQIIFRGIWVIAIIRGHKK